MLFIRVSPLASFGALGKEPNRSGSGVRDADGESE